MYLFSEKPHLEFDLDNNRPTRSLRFPGLQKNYKNEIYTSVDAINIVDDLNIDQLEEYFSDEYYSSPGYIPNSSFLFGSDFEEVTQMVQLLIHCHVHLIILKQIYHFLILKQI